MRRTTLCAKCRYRNYSTWSKWPHCYRCGTLLPEPHYQDNRTTDHQDNQLQLGALLCDANQQDAEASEASTAESRGDTRLTTPSCAAGGGSNVAPPLQLDT